MYDGRKPICVDTFGQVKEQKSWERNLAARLSCSLPLRPFKAKNKKGTCRQNHFALFTKEHFEQWVATQLGDCGEVGSPLVSQARCFWCALRASEILKESESIERCTKFTFLNSVDAMKSVLCSFGICARYFCFRGAVANFVNFLCCPKSQTLISKFVEKLHTVRPV